MAEKKIPVQGTFWNNTDSGKIAYANQIYDSDKGKFQSDINKDVYGTSKATVDLDYKTLTIEPLEVATFANIESVVSSSSTRAVTPSVVRVPYPNVEIYITLPSNIRLQIYYADQLDHSKSVSSGVYRKGVDTWFKNGDTVVFTELYYRLMFKQVDSSNQEVSISPDLNNFVKSGEISLRYKSKDGTVISRNADKETHVRELFSSWNDTTKNFDGMAVLTHISDLHGDVERLKNILEYSDFIEADAVLNSGDAVYMDYRNNAQYQLISKNYSPKYLTCIGNHEVWKANGSGVPAFPENFVKNNYILPYAEDNEYILNNSTTTETYYYVDFEDKNLRVIVLDTHYGNYYGQSSVGAGDASDAAGGQIGKAQFEWFIATLQSTPSNYGVVLMYHENERPIVKNNNYPKFFADRITKLRGESSIYNYNNLGYNNANTGNTANVNGGFFSYKTRPISRIINAFIAGTKGDSGSVITLTEAEANAKGGSTNATGGTVTADFSTLNSGVEFICHICGHIHMDTVGYYKENIDDSVLTYPQLVLNISTGSPCKGGINPQSNFDLPRYWQGVTQDAFNIYIIDRYKKCVRIARIGSNQTYDEGDGHPSYMRDFMDIPYDNSNS